MYYLGKTSKRRLGSCHGLWFIILSEAIKTSPIDFGVVCGGRGRQAQERAYNEERSNARWGESDHNWMLGGRLRSVAVDLAPYSAEHRNFMWSEVVGVKESKRTFKLMSDHIIKTASELGYKVESGELYSTIPGGDPGHHVLRFK